MKRLSRCKPRTYMYLEKKCSTFRHSGNLPFFERVFSRFSSTCGSFEKLFWKFQNHPIRSESRGIDGWKSPTLSIFKKWRQKWIYLNFFSNAAISLTRIRSVFFVRIKIKLTSIRFSLDVESTKAWILTILLPLNIRVSPSVSLASPAPSHRRLWQKIENEKERKKNEKNKKK